MNKLKRVLICGAPDLNYIDGSSIWAQTIAMATAKTGVAQVDFIAKSSPERDELFGPLRAMERIKIINGTDRNLWEGKSYKRLPPNMLADLVERLDRQQPYDVIIIRGLDIATNLLNFPSILGKCWMYLTDIPQDLKEYSAEQRVLIRRIGLGCRRLLCQTEGFKSLWQSLVPQLDVSKYRIYTPVIPDIVTRQLPISERPLQAIYAGKFKGDWMTLEMAQLWPQVHARIPGSELVMIGDKIHDEPRQPNYQERMQYALEETTGLTWLGGRSRESVQQHLAEARVGLSWRAETMNDTVEYSTKILEYGGAGCAAILNRNSLHEKLLGKNYPLFANNSEEFVQQLTRALTQPEIAEQAAQSLRNVAQKHTFSVRTSEIRDWLLSENDNTAPTQKIRILVAGHDLKFFHSLQQKLNDTGKFEFITDQWQGHDKHVEENSKAFLETVDIIVCEWCLGNLKWYSHNKKPHQRLIARFHAQEARLPYLAEANWDAIEQIVFVSEHTRQQALEVFKNFPTSKTSVISNLLDDTKFTPKKKTGDAQYTLGIIGVTPKSKRLDRAVDLLEALLEHDSRYCLRVKGKNPLDYPWLVNRPEELAYYRDLFERINKSPELRHRVIFDPAGDDVNEWFTMVGYILSSSDHESYHMAIGEGILTGATPIIWNWEGAKAIWGSEWIVDSLLEAKSAVLDGRPQNNLVSKMREIVQKQATSHRWEKLILEY
ncbi:MULTISPECIES: glycosyltransferase family protein [Pseudomonas]|uniref:Spore protein YkvP/CgeB glycosyl transferase-like domain-containing protein n=1 Tax=Pseudomonas putida (strain DOT-T1E) TaxID=1196325 RepID=I7C6Y0_PSEPT|nr:MULTISPECIES: glycosyltransferase [Pseudomonas]AFO48881.1 hypothetical protein T1E_3044 [Pseudomonas putida DOT-T1E]UZM91952.1 glycosyltransferase [Pseudomonas putida DOT-T1E]WPO28747.1 glycosyltransferase [Pseudomonas sp. BO3-4]